MSKNLFDYDTHESWGMIGLYHAQSSGSELFGSDVTHHNVMNLTIKQGQCARSLGHDWYIGNELLIEISLSANQFADLLTNANVGDGVPCTIRYRKDKGAVEYKPQTPKIETIYAEADEYAENALASIDESIEKIKALLASGKMPKQAGQEILNSILGARSNLVGGGKDYFKKCAREDVDRMIVEAKREVQSYVDHKIYSTGIQALQEGFTAPALLEEGKNDDNNLFEVHDND